MAFLEPDHLAGPSRKTNGPSTMNYVLQVVRGRSASTTLKLTDNVTSLGRHDDCVIRIKSSQVSRRHCELFEVGGQLMLRDLGSSNGTFVNGKRVTGRAGPEARRRADRRRRHSPGGQTRPTGLGRFRPAPLPNPRPAIPPSSTPSKSTMPKTRKNSRWSSTTASPCPKSKASLWPTSDRRNQPSRKPARASDAASTSPTAARSGKELRKAKGGQRRRRGRRLPARPRSRRRGLNSLTLTRTLNSTPNELPNSMSRIPVDVGKSHAGISYLLSQ